MYNLLQIILKITMNMLAAGKSRRIVAKKLLNEIDAIPM